MTQFTKHPVLYRFEIIPAFRMSLLSNVRLAIFEMHVQDTFAETFETVKDDLAIDAARAVEIMTRIEHKPEQVRDCQPHIAQQAHTEGWDNFKAVQNGVFCELGHGSVP